MPNYFSLTEEMIKVFISNLEYKTSDKHGEWYIFTLNEMDFEKYFLKFRDMNFYKENTDYTYSEEGVRTQFYNILLPDEWDRSESLQYLLQNENVIKYLKFHKSSPGSIEKMFAKYEDPSNELIFHTQIKTFNIYHEDIFRETISKFFDENVGEYVVLGNPEKINILKKIYEENPPYICNRKIVNYILEGMKDINISEVESIIHVGPDYIFNLFDEDKSNEYYIKGILTSTYENTAKLLDYFCKDPLIEKEKRENLKKLIEAFEGNFAFVDSEKYKKNDKKFPHLYGNIAYNDKENRVIKGKIWEYNFKNSTLYIDTDTGRKIVNLTDADNPRILVEAILKSPNFYVHKSDFAFDAEKTLSNLKTNNMGKNGKVDKKYYGIFYMSKGGIGIRKDFEPTENPK